MNVFKDLPMKKSQIARLRRKKLLWFRSLLSIIKAKMTRVLPKTVTEVIRGMKIYKKISVPPEYRDSRSSLEPFALMLLVMLDR